MASHRHQHQKRRKTTTPDDFGGRKMSMKRTFSEIGRQFSMKSRGMYFNLTQV